MKDICEKTQNQLVDIKYNELKITSEIENHLEECSMCKAYYNSLLNLEKEFDLSLNINEDENTIKNAFQKVENMEKKRVFILENVKFAVLVAVVFSGFSIMVLNKLYILIFALQIFIITVSPFIIPILINKRLEE
jgi:predicted anti-sigma-YlaC factor YlaD